MRITRLPIASLCLLFCLALPAQNPANVAPAGMSVGVRFTATRASLTPNTCGCFLLLGGAADAALPLHGPFSVVAEVAGNHTGSVPSTTRGLSTITLLAGPRYTLSVLSRQRVFAQALFGAVRGFDADFRRGNDPIDTATAFSYALGGGYEVALTPAVSLRAAQVEFLQTNLPNGSDNRQRNIRFGAGLTFHFTTASFHR